MKVLQFAKHFHPDPGGIETVTQALSEMLVPHGIQADVLCTKLNNDHYADLNLPYKVIRTDADAKFGNKVLSLEYIRSAKHLANEYDAAILHLPNPLGALAAWLYWRRPLILYWHADVPQAVLRTLLSPLDRALARQAKLVISPTAAHTDGSHVASSIAPKRRVIALPLDTRRLAKVEVSQRVADIRKWIGNRPMVLAVGRLVPYKGLPVLLRAAHGVGAAVVIAGSGPMAGELQQSINSQALTDKVLMCGGLSDGELAYLYAEATLLCLPSVTSAEMYGMVQVEAMSFGKPIVSTNIPNSGVSHVNVHNRTGLVVPPGDADALAEAINAILSDEALRNRLAQGARESFAHDHDMHRLGKNYAELLREAVS